MSRTSRGKARRRRIKLTFAHTRGFRGNTQSWRVANQRMMSALTDGYIGRKRAKRDHRRLWICRLNAGLAPTARYADYLRQHAQLQIGLNRKCLSQMTLVDHPGFHALVDHVVR
jgi:large subunit ribosomal protein L20